MKKFKLYIKTFGIIAAIRHLYRDYLHARERCAYCGWYLHPQLLFKGIKRPTKLTYWKENNDLFVCAKCHYLHKQLE